MIDAAVEGKPQFVESRDGKEVVIVSRDYFERTKPNMKTYLLNEVCSGDGEEAFEAILQNVRAGFPDVPAARDHTD